MSLPSHFSIALLCASLCAVPALAPASAQSPAGSQSSSSSSSTPDTNPMQREKAPSLVDPTGQTVSLLPSEQVFLMSSALNACGYDEGLEESMPVRAKVRDEMNQAF